MRVGFVLRSTEIKPLFHRFVPLMQKFFFRIHASCATLNISFTLERYWSSIITGLGLVMVVETWKAMAHKSSLFSHTS